MNVIIKNKANIEDLHTRWQAAYAMICFLLGARYPGWGQDTQRQLHPQGATVQEIMVGAR